MSGVSRFHREVVEAVLPVLNGHGFALAGGNALLAHGLSERPTTDVNLFTNQENAVSAVAAAVESALRNAGFHVERIDTFSGLLDDYPEMAELRAEWTVSRHGQQVMLQLASNSRWRHPVTMGFGPVLDARDALAGKMIALATRAEARDYIDVAAAMIRYTPEALINLAWSAEPGLTHEDFTFIGPALDHMSDAEFTRYGLSGDDIARLRRVFADWPRV